MKIRSYQPEDEAAQAALFNVAAFSLPGFKPAMAEDVRRRTRARSFDPTTRFYADVDGRLVGYCVLEPEQGRISFPWCKVGYEAAGPELFDRAIQSARERGLTKLFAAYRRDWEPVLRFLADRGFTQTREMINYWLDPTDVPTLVNRSRGQFDSIKPEDIPALAEMGKGVIRVSPERLHQYVFANPFFASEAYLVLRDGNGVPTAVGAAIENPNYADVKKIDPLAPCFRLGAFGTEGLNTKRVNGLFSLLVADPQQYMTVGLGLLSQATLRMTEESASNIAAQCPSDAPHLVGFYSRCFKEQGRFPVLEKTIG